MLLYLEHSGQIGHYTLEHVSQVWGVAITHRHSAMGDAQATAAIFLHLTQQLVKNTMSVARLVRLQTQAD